VDRGGKFSILGLHTSHPTYLLQAANLRLFFASNQFFLSVSINRILFSEIHLTNFRNIFPKNTQLLFRIKSFENLWWSAGRYLMNNLKQASQRKDTEHVITTTTLMAINIIRKATNEVQEKHSTEAQSRRFLHRTLFLHLQPFPKGLHHRLTSTSQRKRKKLRRSMVANKESPQLHATLATVNNNTYHQRTHTPHVSHVLNVTPMRSTERWLGQTHSLHQSFILHHPHGGRVTIHNHPHPVMQKRNPWSLWNIAGGKM